MHTYIRRNTRDNWLKKNKNMVRYRTVASSHPPSTKTQNLYCSFHQAISFLESVNPGIESQYLTNK